MRISHSAKEKYTTCPYSYYLYYMMKWRPVGNRSSLTFGDAIDTGLNCLLETRDIDKAVFEFNTRWDKLSSDDIKYSKSDLDEFLIEDIKFETEQRMFAESLKRKGNILLQEYNKQIMPRIKEVKAIQIDKFVPNEQGDLLQIKTDFIAVWEDNRTILFDNKTSSVKYAEDSVKTSEQLGIYYETLKSEYNIDICGYIVIPKRVNKKKEPRVDIKVIIDNVDEETIINTLQSYDDVLVNIKQGCFPKNENSCMGKYGKCDYWEWCKNRSCSGLEEKK